MKTVELSATMVKRTYKAKNGKTVVDTWYYINMSNEVNDFDINIDKVRFESFLKEFSLAVDSVKYKEDCEITKYY